MASRRRPQSARDPVEERRQYIEDFGMVLTDMGFHRMAARVFAALLITDSGRMTAGELAETLTVSPAAISGAVRYLDQVGLVSKERIPGERRDFYRVRDDMWYASFLKRDRLMMLWRDHAKRGIDLVGADSPAGHRLAEMRDFFEFMIAEIPAMFDRWHALRAAS